MFLHISRSVQVPAYEMTDQTCRGCGRVFRGNHWTKPPCASQRLEWVFEGRLLGWCGPCITARDERRRRQDEAEQRRRMGDVMVREVRRPQRTTSDTDGPPF